MEFYFKCFSQPWNITEIISALNFLPFSRKPVLYRNERLPLMTSKNVLNE